MAFEPEKEVYGREAVAGRRIKLLENFGKEHDQINYGGNDNDAPQLVKDLGIDFKKLIAN